MMKKPTAIAAAAMLAATSCAALAEGAAVGMPDPWTQINYIEAQYGFRFPDAVDPNTVVFRSMGEDGLEEMLFSLDGRDYTVRAQVAEEMTDLSGVYGEVTETAEGTVAGTPYRLMYVKDGESTTAVLLWMEEEQGVAYSLTVQGEDVRSVDMPAMAAQCDQQLADDLQWDAAAGDLWNTLDDDQSVAMSSVIEEYYDMLSDLQDEDVSEERKAELSEKYMLALGAPNFGYCLKDMDGDGVPELVIMADANDEDDYYHGMILEMYRLTEEKTARLVLASEERSRYYYAGDGLIAYEGSNGADDSIETTYRLVDGELVDQGTPADHHENLAVVYIGIGG